MRGTRNESYGVRWRVNRAVAIGLLGLVGVGLAGIAGCSATKTDKATAKAGAEGMNQAIQKTEFGKTKDGVAVQLYRLTNKANASVHITNYGGLVTQISVPDRNGKIEDVVLGFGKLDGYTATKPDGTFQTPYFGALTGRVANRIAKGTFSLDGNNYHTPINNNGNTLHGGLLGFDKLVWEATPMKSADGPQLSLHYVSKDGEEGFPGNLDTTVTYTWTDANELKIHYKATTDKSTIVNLTNHSYFNLSGESDGSILDHVITLYADKYTPTDDLLIPTGEVAPVKGTPLDFTEPKVVGERIEQVGKDPTGYDHNFVVNGKPGVLRKAAKVMAPKSGRVMEVSTTEPAIQLYTGNFLDGTLTGTSGLAYPKHAAFCLETQHYPDSINHPDFPSTVLKPGQTYDTTTVYKFSVAK